MRLATPLLAILIAAASTPGRGAEANNYEQNRLDALHYRPAAGKYEPYASVHTYLPETQDNYQNGTQTATVTRTYLDADLGVVYGIQDTLSVSVVESYLFAHPSTNTNSKTGALSTTDSSGLSDPTLTLNYRYFGGLTGSRFGNVYASLEPALGTATSASTHVNGNNLSSSTLLAIGTNYFWVCGSSEFEARADISTHTNGSSTPQGDNSAVTTKTYTATDVEGFYRFHFLNDFYVQPEAEVNLPYNVSSTNPNHNPTLLTTSQYPWRLTTSVDFGVRVKEALVLDMSYSYTSYTEDAFSNAGKTYTTYSYDIQQGVLKVQATYEL